MFEYSIHLKAMRPCRIGNESVVFWSNSPEDGCHEGDHGAGGYEECRRRFLDAVKEIHAEDAGDDGAGRQRQSPHLHEERHPNHTIPNRV